MSTYLFRDKYFGVSQEGVHFLRNGYTYKTVEFADVDIVRIKRGKAIKNWIVVFIIGLFALGLALYGLKGLYEIFQSANGGRIHIEYIVAPFLPLMVGAYALYVSLKKEEIIEVVFGGKIERFSTKELQNSPNFEAIIELLQNKTKFHRK
ncbi:MAG: hypothetical protein AB8B69_10320 [Chitinophagales bacterium]